MEKKISSKTENILCLGAIIIFEIFIRFLFPSDVYNNIFARSFLSTSIMSTGAVSTLQNFSDSGLIYAAAITLNILATVFVFIFCIKNIRNSDNGNSFVNFALCVLLFTVPCSFVTLWGTDYFSLAGTVTYLAFGVCLLFADSKKFLPTVLITVVAAAIFSPFISICVATAFLPIFLYENKFKIKKKNETNFSFAFLIVAIIIIVIDFFVCIISVTPSGSVKYTEGFVSLLFTAPVLIPIYAIWIKAGNKFFNILIFSPLFSLPVFILAPTFGMGTIVIITSQLVSVLYFLSKKDKHIISSSNEVFGFLKSHIFTAIIYLLYCFTVSAYSSDIAGHICKLVLNYSAL